MITIEQKKQLSAIVCDEVNVKELRFKFRIKSEQGPIELVYNRKDNDYHLELDGQEVAGPKTLELLIGELYK